MQINNNINKNKLATIKEGNVAQPTGKIKVDSSYMGKFRVENFIDFLQNFTFYLKKLNVKVVDNKKF